MTLRRLAFNDSPHLSPTGELAVWDENVQNRARVESIQTMAGIEKALRAETIAR